MHSIGSLLLVLILSLVPQEGAAPAPQENLPAGPYQQTCTDISVKNGNLYAKCHDEKGKARSAKLSHYDRCKGEIVNRKGSLECSHASPPLPPGPYTESCKNAQMRGSTLHAVCRSVDGREMPVALKDANRCSQGVANMNGILTCVVNEVIPPGSYMATCKDIRVQGTTLYASCNDGSNKDRWINARMRDAHKCSGDISNYHGELRCAEIKKMEKR